MAATFNTEAEMKEPVMRWLQELDLVVRSEFVLPWGICDLVALKFNKRHVSRRVRLRQKAAITSAARAALLLRIPDVESKSAVALADLAAECAPFISPDAVLAETQQLIEDRFVVTAGDMRFQKVNGWMPLQSRIVAIEMKRERVQDAVRQAHNNLSFADESYVALPMPLATRIASHPVRRDDLRSMGVGLIAVDRQSCKILIRCRKAASVNHLLQFCAVEKFWRLFAKGS